MITDGLALVAYAATGQLSGPGRRYAWSVVVLAAGLSGLAQATYLAGGLGSAPTGLRFGVGAWPAIAAAIAAHLLFLIGSAGRDTDPELSRPSVQPVPPVQSLSHSINGQRPLAVDAATEPRSEAPPLGHLEASGGTPSQADRARRIAQLHLSRTGTLPSIRELAELADVGRGTADRALATLRTATNGAQPGFNCDDEEPEQ